MRQLLPLLPLILPLLPHIAFALGAGVVVAVATWLIETAAILTGRALLALIRAARPGRNR